jgi:hypothetical protein
VFLGILNSRWPHVGWWHQLTETWLIVDLTGNLTCGALRDAAMEAFPDILHIVIEANGPGKWSAFLRTNDFVWIREQWDRNS